MNWYKRAAALEPDNIAKDIHAAISHLVEGQWEITHNANLLPPYYLQKYKVVELVGKNIISKPGYEFFIKVFIHVKLTTQKIPPLKWEEVNGLWKGPDKENFQRYDSGYGHKLLYFFGFVRDRTKDFGYNEQVDFGQTATGSAAENITTPYEVAEEIRRIVMGWGKNGDDPAPEPVAPTAPVGRTPVLV